MSYYDDKILPHVIDKICSTGQVMKLRSEIVPLSKGVVLEVGMGSGINLEFYSHQQVEMVYGLEPSHGMRKKAQANLNRSPVIVEWLDLPGESIPLEDESVDTVLLTFTLCTIPGWKDALAQMHRVLRPGGKLLFLEHGASPDDAVHRWQDRITPTWKKIAGGCHLNRPISELIAASGFVIDELENLYMPKTPKIAGYIYKGAAHKAL